MFYDKNKPVDDQRNFSESGNTTSSPMKGTKSREPEILYNWKQPIRQFKSYTLTVLPNKKGFKATKKLTRTYFSHFY